MIHKFLILIDDKLTINNFTINRLNDKIIVSINDNLDRIYRIPVYNKYTGVYYFPLYLPLELWIVDGKIFNPYIILSSYNLVNENSLDFFNILRGVIRDRYNLEFYTFEEVISNDELIKKIIEYYNSYLLFNFGAIELNLLIKRLWLSINLSKLLTIILLIKTNNYNKKNLKSNCQKYNIIKKLVQVGLNLKLFKYELYHNATFYDYYNYKFNTPLKLTDLREGQEYYIIIYRNTNSNTDIILSNDVKSKISKVKVIKIIKNLINISENNNLIFDNYNWYDFPPNIKIDRDYILFMTFINDTFTREIIKHNLGIDNNHTEKILSYYQIDEKRSNLLILNKYYQDLLELEEIELLKGGSYSNDYFQYITKKYSSDSEKRLEILKILFDNYSYPLKVNKHNMDYIFDQIIYYSLYNYKYIFNGKNYSEFLQSEINNIIPIKLKNLYINLLKTLYQLINNDYESITFNQKFYNEYLHKNIIKLFFSDTNKLSINLFKELIKLDNFERFKRIIQTNTLLVDISYKLNWGNLTKKLNYLGFFYKNTEYLYINGKFNKNILSDNFDNRIKKVIENPFEMYRYLRKEKDFIKWTKFISDKIIQLYYIPISLSSEDFNFIGKIIYLLFNVIEQNIKDKTYIQFINYCNQHTKLILDSNRINFKIKEVFPNLKCNINLGFLAKHLLFKKNIITFEDNKNDIPQEVIILETKLKLVTKKYHKYKAKYLKSKNITVIKTPTGYQIDKSSETSSINYSMKSI